MIWACMQNASLKTYGDDSHYYKENMEQCQEMLKNHLFKRK